MDELLDAADRTLYAMKRKADHPIEFARIVACM